MKKVHGKTRRLARKPRFTDFWEVWVLALLLVTILGLFANSKHTGLFSTSQANSQFDPYDIRPEEPGHELGRPLESGM